MTDRPKPPPAGPAWAAQAWAAGGAGLFCAPLPLSHVDLDPTACALWGLASPGPVGLDALVARVHADDSGALLAALAACTAAQAPLAIDLRLAAGPGQAPRRLQLAGQLTGQDSGTATHLAGVVVELSAATDVAIAERVDRERRAFLYLAAHEMKAPLAGLKLQVQMLSRTLQRGALSEAIKPRLQGLVHTASRQTDRLVHLIEELLEVSSGSTKPLQLEVEEVDLVELVHGVLRNQSAALEDAGCPVRAELPEHLPVHADRERLQRALDNVLDNVVRYASGGPVNIALATDANDRVALEVRDTGPGIAPQDHERIFHQFERGADQPTNASMGLGLYVSRRIVESHGGEIALHSAPGSGSTFVVRLPRVPPAVSMSSS